MIDPEKARQLYKRSNQDISERELQLLLLRSELLHHNQLFNDELDGLDRDDSDAVKQFSRRWHVDSDALLSLPKPAVEFLQGSYESMTIDVRVDLQASKKLILEQLERLVDEQKKYLADCLPGASYPWEMSPMQLAGNQAADLEDLVQSVKVYDLRQAGATWASIARELKLNNAQSARNFHNRASRMVATGVAGMPEFPTERAVDLRGDGYGVDVDGITLNPAHPWYRHRPVKFRGVKI